MDFLLSRHRQQAQQPGSLLLAGPALRLQLIALALAVGFASAALQASRSFSLLPLLLAGCTIDKNIL